MTKRILSLLFSFSLLFSGAALSESPIDGSIAIVSYDRAVLQDWTPSYGVTMPGILLELSHSEGLLTVSAVDSDDAQTPDAHLQYRLDRAGETLVVSDACIDVWDDPLNGNGRLLSFSYTYPEGDEEHLCCMWAAALNESTIFELTVDTWGADAQTLMELARAAFLNETSPVRIYENAFETTAMLTDVIEKEDGRVEIQLTNEASGSQSYRLASNAVLLFPNPDDPSLFYLVEADMPSLVDAVLTYEESSDSSPVFHAVLSDGNVVYMEYDLIR